MRLTIAYSKKKRNLVLINNATHKRETLPERPIRPPLRAWVKEYLELRKTTLSSCPTICTNIPKNCKSKTNDVCTHRRNKVLVTEKKLYYLTNTSHWLLNSCCCFNLQIAFSTLQNVVVLLIMNISAFRWIRYRLTRLIK